MSILVTGTVALDSIETPFGKKERCLGGSATHFSMSASFFSQINLVAVVGEDFPKEHIEMLSERNINLDGLKTEKGKTFFWEGRYDFDLSNPQTLKTELNVLEVFNPILPDNYKDNDILFLANVDPVLQLKVIKQVNKPKLVALDTMNFWIEGKNAELKETLKYIDVLTINEGEARLLANESNLLKASKIIREMGPKTLVIKQGEYGALLFQDDHIFSAPGLPLEDIKDPTGAGDSFAGGMMGYLAKKGSFEFDDFKQAIIFGSVMASFNVTEFSCDRLKTLTTEDIFDRYQQFRSLSCFEEITI
jgi:sugar/nucleoside kinase (ribokinase family)